MTIKTEELSEEEVKVVNKSEVKESDSDDPEPDYEPSKLDTATMEEGEIDENEELLDYLEAAGIDSKALDEINELRANKELLKKVQSLLAENEKALFFSEHSCEPTDLDCGIIVFSKVKSKFIVAELTK